MNIKRKINNWYNNLDENTQLNIDFWICPIMPFNRLDLELRNIAGILDFPRIAWYNIYLLFFKIGGKFRILNTSWQNWYNVCNELKQKKEGKL